MANCTNCDEFQPRLKKGSKCNECFIHGNRNIVKRIDANVVQELKHKNRPNPEQIAKVFFCCIFYKFKMCNS